MRGIIQLDWFFTPQGIAHMEVGKNKQNSVFKDLKNPLKTRWNRSFKMFTNFSRKVSCFSFLVKCLSCGLSRQLDIHDPTQHLCNCRSCPAVVWDEKSERRVFVRIGYRFMCASRVYCVTSMEENHQDVKEKRRKKINNDRSLWVEWHGEKMV